MFKYCLVFVLAFILCLLEGCSKPDVEDYQDNAPLFNFKDFYSGPVEVWGIIQDFNGKMVKSFTVKMDCQWQENKGTIHETFLWSDGTTTNRIWKLEQVSDHHFKGFTDEMDGEAEGKAAGNAMQWSYHLKVPINGEMIEFDFDDWTYAVEPNLIINRSKMKKMGLTIGDVTIVMHKVKGEQVIMGPKA